jgi:hypothetical protein
MTNLQQRLNKIIEEEKFTVFEISGFTTDHRLSLLAGAALGYRLATEDALKALTISED